jgi:hypothetical protein
MFRSRRQHVPVTDASRFLPDALVDRVFRRVRANLGLADDQRIADLLPPPPGRRAPDALAPVEAGALRGGGR